MAVFSDPAGEAGGILARQAYSHAVSILLGFAEDPKSDAPPEVHVASAGLINFEESVCAVTCQHVLDDYELLHQREPRYGFQIGSYACNPLEILRDSDAGLDLAILDVSKLPPDRLNNRRDGQVQALTPTRWPADPVHPGDLVILCGFPTGTREVNVVERKIASIAFPLIEHVMDVDGDDFTISFNRHEWVNIANDEPAPSTIQAVDINGLSGSPVFSSRRSHEGVQVMDFVGTVLAEIGFEDGVTRALKPAHCSRREDRSRLEQSSEQRRQLRR